jgi:hypothetical protein
VWGKDSADEFVKDKEANADALPIMARRRINEAVELEREARVHCIACPRVASFLDALCGVMPGG